MNKPPYTLRDLQEKIIHILPSIENEKAILHLRMGLMYRSYLMNENYLYLLENQETSQSITYKQAYAISMNLNSFYIHLRGGLDNIAFMLDSILNLQLYFRKIDLFGTKFCVAVSNHISNFQNLIDSNSEWYNEFKNKRDTVAHRIPIHVPNTSVIIDEENYDTLLTGEQVDTVSLFKGNKVICKYLPVATHFQNDNSISVADNVNVHNYYPIPNTVKDDCETFSALAIALLEIMHSYVITRN